MKILCMKEPLRTQQIFLVIKRAFSEIVSAVIDTAISIKVVGENSQTYNTSATGIMELKHEWPSAITNKVSSIIDEQ